MQPDQRQQDTAGTWQDALSPRLVKRLARPLTRPGVIAPGLGRAIIARMQHTGAPMPLLDRALRRLHSVEDAQTARRPIVYARPAPTTAQPAASEAEARPLPAAAHLVVRPTLAPTTSPPPGASPPLALPVVRANMRATEPSASGSALQRSAGTVAAQPSPLPPQAVSREMREAPASPRSDHVPPLVLGAQGPGREHGARQTSVDAAPAVPPPGPPLPPAAAPALPTVQPLHAAPAPSPPGARPAAAASDEPVRIVLPPGRRIQRGESAAPPAPPRPPVGDGADRPRRAGAESELTPVVPPAIQRAPRDPGPPDTHATAAAQPGAAPPERLPLARPLLAPSPATPAMPVAPRPPLDAVTPPRPTPQGPPATSQPAPMALPLAPVATVQRRVVTPAVGSPWPTVAETAPAGPVVTPLRRVERAEQAPLTLRGADAAKVQATPAPPSPQRPSAAPLLQAASDATLAGPSADLPAADAASQPAGPDVNQIAAQVYELLVRRIASERERRGR